MSHALKQQRSSCVTSPGSLAGAQASLLLVQHHIFQSTLQDFRVLVARDTAHLPSTHPSWCGWRRAAARAAAGALRRPALPPCVVALPTFRAAVVAVVPAASTPGEACDLDVTLTFAPVLPLRLVGGVALFVGAPALAASATFRVSAGALTFSATAAAILTIVLIRSLPSKRALATAAALLGSGAATGARLVFGHWVPTLSDLASPRVAFVYAACSLGAGAALAYWYDDPGATKAHAILAAALRAGGLAAVVGGTSHTGVGAATAVLLATWLAAPRLAAAGGVAARALQAVTPARKRRGPLPPLPPRRPSSAGGHPSLVPPLSAAAALPLPTGDEASPTPRWASATGEWGDRDARTASPPFRREHAFPLHAAAPPSPPPLAAPSATPSATPSLVARRPPPPGVPPSPLLARGLCLNEATGKTIKVGGATFNRLVLDGFVLDEAAGTLTPPPRRRGEGERSSALRSGARRR